MPRLLFEKTGDAVWMSHLDLMRLFQRAFKRAGLPLTHTQGFNPRPSVSIALPLSVGVESVCELLDFDLDGETVDCNEIATQLNEALVSGVKVLSVYPTGAKLRELAYLRCRIEMEYDNGVPANAVEKIRALFSQDSLTVEKKTKNGMQEQDIIPMIRELSAEQAGEKTLCLNALICCQNPTLNPAQMVSAIGTYLPEVKPDFSKCRRLEIYDKQLSIFR